ncbi:MAG: hypothetical protein FJ096_09120 [Deltaproteobacteria bacterium]|nr:hypothetical protein [Deltaproteobacteria bacterium]
MRVNDALAAGALLLLAGCSALRGAPPVLLPGEKDTPGIPLALRASRSRPRIALLRRTGDPEGAVAVAVAAPRVGPQATWENLALAALLDLRLRGGGFESRSTADGAGLRLAITVRDAEHVRRLIRSLPAIVSAETSEREVQLVVARLERESIPRIFAPYAALAACSGDGGLLTSHGVLPTVTRQTLDALRVESLRTGAVALGVVGPADLTEAASDQLESAPAWPLREEPLPLRVLESHHATTVATSAIPVPALEVTWPLDDPRRALAVAEVELRRHSPLRARLALSGSEFKLVEVRATARPDGGCLRMRFEAQDVSRERLPSAAAGVLAQADLLVREPLDADAEEPRVAQRIAAAESAREAAELAAWWTLAGGATAPGVTGEASSVLVIAPHRDDGEQTYSELDEGYRSAIARRPRGARPERGAEAARPFSASIEPGQGESWLLLANDCAATEESRWDQGRGALAAHVAAAFPSERGITVEPWVRADGVGLLAHGPRHESESAEAAGRRLGRVLGAALTSVPFSDGRLARAQATLLPDLATDTARRLEALRDHPTLRVDGAIHPHGGLARLLATTSSDAEERWRALLRGTWRGAMIASVGAAEVTVASRELSRWLPTSDPASCPPRRAAGGSVTVERVDTPMADAFALILVESRAANEWRIVETLATALELDPQRAASTARSSSASSRIHWLGGRRAPTLAIEVSGSPSAVEVGVASWRERLDALRGQGMSRSALDAAIERLRRTRALEDGTTRGRVERLWLGAEPAEPSLDAMTRWLRANLAPTDIDVLVGTPSPR